MEKKVHVLLITTLMVMIGFSCMSHVSEAGDPIPPPPYNPLEVDFWWEPELGYYGETVDFHGTCSGGTEPYNWTWTFPGPVYKYGQNTDFIFYPIESPTDYEVTLTVTDSSDIPYYGPFVKSKNKFVEIRIDYDVYVLDIDMDKRFYDIYEEITGTAIIKNLFHMCPYFTVRAWIVGIPNWYDEETVYNLPANPPFNLYTFNFEINNPGPTVPPGLPYVVKVEIVDPGEYDRSLLFNWKLSKLFWVL